MKKMSLIIEKLDKKNLIGIYIFQNAFYILWFAYIFGVLGHVCPVAFLGVWTASIVGCYVFTKKRPRFLGMIVSLIFTAVFWGIAFFFLHPNEIYGWKVDTLYRYVNLAPFIVLILTIPLLVFIQIIFTNRLKPWKRNHSTKIELLLEKLFSLVSVLGVFAGLYYTISPSMKKSSWNDSTTEWFDTVFYEGDNFYLFLVLAILGIISGIFMLINWILKYLKNEKTSSNRYITTRILGHTFFGMVLIGTWSIFVYTGAKNEEQIEKKKNKIQE